MSYVKADVFLVGEVEHHIATSDGRVPDGPDESAAVEAAACWVSSPAVLTMLAVDRKVTLRIDGTIDRLPFRGLVTVSVDVQLEPVDEGAR